MKIARRVDASVTSIRGSPAHLARPSGSPFRPNILANGRKHALIGPLIIGRAHHECPSDHCMRHGFWRLPDIIIYDSESYVSRHHAKVQLDKNGSCWIEDLYSLNGTAILRVAKNSARWRSPYSFENLQPGRGYKLLDGDIVALAHNPSRGPYVTISYHTT
jgi:hypothetical protein